MTRVVWRGDTTKVTADVYRPEKLTAIKSVTPQARAPPVPLRITDHFGPLRIVLNVNKVSHNSYLILLRLHDLYLAIVYPATASSHRPLSGGPRSLPPKVGAEIKVLVLTWRKWSNRDLPSFGGMPNL